jgi:hypothetical protein
MFDYEESTEYFECSCSDKDHLLVVETRKYEDGLSELAVYKSMSHYLSWYKRTYHAFRYILGMKPTRYHFTETIILNPVDMKRLLNTIKECADYRKGSL